VCNLKKTPPSTCSLRSTFLLNVQLIQHILADAKDDTELYLLFANQTENDIFMRKELEEFAQNKQFKLWYTVDRPPANWTYRCACFRAVVSSFPVPAVADLPFHSEGFINEQMLREHMPAAGPDSVILMCGPPPMIKFACIPNLEKIGYTAEQFVTF
jgi:cytochrome-b5 reductase